MENNQNSVIDEGSDKLKEIIASHIKSAPKREMFLNSVGRTDYIISGLNFKDVIGYKWVSDDIEDANRYLFENCIFDGSDTEISLLFRSDYISFENCHLKGQVVIKNIGLDEESTIEIKDIEGNCNEELSKLVIESAVVQLKNKRIECLKKISISAVCCEIDACHISSPIIDVEYLNILTITNSNLYFLIPKTAPIIYPEKDHQSLIIESSMVNSNQVDYYNSDDNPIDKRISKK